MPLKLPKRLRKGGTTASAAYKRSARQEKEVAQRLVRVVRGSGRLIEKGDVRVKGLVRVECKTTTAKSYRILLDDLKKLALYAGGAGEIPVFLIEFIDQHGKKNGEVAVVEFHHLQEIIDARS